MDIWTVTFSISIAPSRRLENTTTVVNMTMALSSTVARNRTLALTAQRTGILVFSITSSKRVTDSFVCASVNQETGRQAAHATSPKIQLASVSLPPLTTAMSTTTMGSAASAMPTGGGASASVTPPATTKTSGGQSVVYEAFISFLVATFILVA
ncbi:hypothetical protein BC830DRAFT_749128 [Chytriomyces sp. MP71]|nr:hypothetical protein BC830DRAFT_749128 [Chytriomyces sp. MP71]